MRVVNRSGRLNLVADGRAVDVETASAGRFSADPHRSSAVGRVRLVGRDGRIRRRRSARRSGTAGSDPRPGQIFAVGVNYADHVEESGIELPDTPFVFTKFPCRSPGRTTPSSIPAARGLRGRACRGHRQTGPHVPVERGWDHVAGLTLGQDLSERDLQLSGPAPQQFSLVSPSPVSHRSAPSWSPRTSSQTVTT